MFVKMYRYRIHQRDYPAWLELTREAEDFVRQHGELEVERDVSRLGKQMTIEERFEYASKDVFENLMEQLGQTTKAKEMSKLFASMVQGDISEDELGE